MTQDARRHVQPQFEVNNRPSNTAGARVNTSSRRSRAQETSTRRRGDKNAAASGEHEAITRVVSGPSSVGATPTTTDRYETRQPAAASLSSIRTLRSLNPTILHDTGAWSIAVPSSIAGSSAKYESPLQKTAQVYKAISNQAKHNGFFAKDRKHLDPVTGEPGISEFPQTLRDFLTHRMEWNEQTTKEQILRMEQAKKAKSKDVHMASKYSVTGLELQLVKVKPFPAHKLLKDGRTTVLGHPSIWAVDQPKGVEGQDRAEWPGSGEMKNEGEKRAREGLRREMCLPRLRKPVARHGEGLVLGDGSPLVPAVGGGDWVGRQVVKLTGFDTMGRIPDGGWPRRICGKPYRFFEGETLTSDGLGVEDLIGRGFLAVVDGKEEQVGKVSTAAEWGIE